MKEAVGLVLIILIVFGAFGYVWNEYIDVSTEKDAVATEAAAQSTQMAVTATGNASTVERIMATSMAEIELRDLTIATLTAGMATSEGERFASQTEAAVEHQRADTAEYRNLELVSTQQALEAMNETLANNAAPTATPQAVVPVTGGVNVEPKPDGPSQPEAAAGRVEPGVIGTMTIFGGFAFLVFIGTFLLRQNRNPMMQPYVQKAPAPRRPVRQYAAETDSLKLRSQKKVTMSEQAYEEYLDYLRRGKQ